METEKIMETVRMVSEEKLDLRTITMGISLLDCIDSDSDRACQKIYEKITKKAKDLVRVGEKIETEFGIPVANKRITVTPISSPFTVSVAVAVGACASPVKVSGVVLHSSPTSFFSTVNEPEAKVIS